MASVMSLVAAPSLAQENAASALPGGASVVNEVHGDWTVSCAAAASGTNCSLAQVRVNPQTGQRIYGVELLAKTSDTAGGAFMLPFGLRVSAPIRLAVDDVALGQDRPFSTCNQYGCFVPAEFSAAELSALRAGVTLTATATDNLSANTTSYAFSLSGLTSAFNRALELGK
jgi:invasion protein IalB